MEVRGLETVACNLPYGPKHRCHLARIGIASGVPQGDQVATGFDHLAGQRTQVSQRHLALAGAAKGH
ncbi:hypothetical protein D3C77_620920 [compost metagenome]